MQLFTVRRRVLYVSVVLLMMLDTLKRFSDSTAYAISMWLMELLVLLLIAYEVMAAIWRHQVVKRRLHTLLKSMEKGHKLEEDTPHPGWPSERISPWKDSVNAWIQETQLLLKSYSAQAEIAFLHDPHVIQPNYRLPVREYHLLVTRLNNLRGIMERPEVYF